MADATKIVKAMDDVRLNDGVLELDPELRVPLAPNTRYEVSAVVFFETGAAEDFCFRWVGPVDSVKHYLNHQSCAGGSPSVGSVRADNVPLGQKVPLGGGAGYGMIVTRGLIHTGSVAGDLVFEWCQLFPGPNATTVLAGSYIEVVGV